MTLVEILLAASVCIFLIIYWAVVVAGWVIMLAWIVDLRSEHRWRVDLVDCAAVVLGILMLSLLTLIGVVLTLWALGVEI